MLTGDALGRAMVELLGGKVTIAVKSFLRHTAFRDQPTPPHGHLSVWMEEMKLPEVVL